MLNSNNYAQTNTTILCLAVCMVNPIPFLWFHNLSISIKPTSVPQLHAVVQPPGGQDIPIPAEHQLVD